VSGKRQLFNGVINRIAGIGIELEGGWDNPVPGHNIVRDGSVKFKEPKTRVERDPITHAPTIVYVNPEEKNSFPKYDIGEIVSPAKPSPLTIDTFADWMRLCYPQHVNETCGLHVHMSFYTKLNYSRLISPDYTPHIISELKEFGRKRGIPGTGQGAMFWNRLDPNHPWTLQHCTHLFLGDKQVLIRKKDYNSRGTSHSRYTFINYCEAQHHTVECRGLPMFEDVGLAIDAVAAVIDATNRYLSKMRLREKPSPIVVPERPVVYQEVGSIIR
jgi:hypothetical protein